MGNIHTSKIGRPLAWLIVLVLVAVQSTFLQTGAYAAETGADKRAVLAANTAFYKVFREQDIEAMDALWARSVKASVIHPGWNAITGRGKVMRSWRDIIMTGGAPQIYPAQSTVTVHNGMATVLCYERIGDNYLAATNIFVFENGKWLMTHHHAAPAPRAGKLFKGDPA